VRGAATAEIEAADFRTNAKNLVQVMRRCPGSVNRLQGYVQILGIAGTQMADRNRLHEVDERLLAGC